MALLYKPDWEEAKERIEAWWAHELLDRCVISVQAPKADVPEEKPPVPPTKVENHWLDYEYRAALNDYGLRRTFFGGEAFPIWHPGYSGWAWVPTFLGAPLTLDERTGWNEAIIADGALTDHDYTSLQIDPDDRWWRLSHEMLRQAAEQCRGKAIVSVGAFGGCGDTLAALRSNTKLLTDLLDCPDYVAEFDQYLMRQWTEVYESFYDITSAGGVGSTCWFGLWSPAKFYSSHNDFAYMISPAMFEEIFLPSIRMQTEFLDHTVHHLDGEGNFNHTDALLELPRLQALQVLPGAGKPSPLHYMDVLRKVQAAGKNLHITIPPDEVETALQQLSPRGLWIATHCDTEQQARDLLKKTEKWSREHGVH